MAAAAPTSSAENSRWLFGPLPDLLLGCGGVYLLVFLAMGAAGAQFRSVFAPWVIPFMLLVTTVPHYGATLLRVYERRADRQAYAFFAVWATAFIYALFVAGVYNQLIGALLVTVYLTWTPWHYSGQNYGISLMFLHRRGVRVTPVAKRLIYASFVLSFGLVFLGVHAATPSVAYAPVDPSQSGFYGFMPLGIPLPVATLGLLLCVAGYVGSLIGATVLLRREASSWGDLAPSGLIVLLQGLWFSLPVLARAFGVLQGFDPFSTRFAVYVLFWAAMGHAVQYLWISAYYAHRAHVAPRYGSYLVKTFFVGGAIWAVPLFLFSPDVLGVYAADAGLAMLVISAVNLHHFVLDGAIWKLRDGRIARILLRRAQESPGEAPALGAPRRSWMRPVVWGLGAAYAIYVIVGTVELEFGVERAIDPPNAERMRTAAERLRWIGRDHPDVRYNLGALALASGDFDTAQRELERSVRIGPSSRGWLALANVHERTRSWPRAIDAYESALALEPDNVQALARAARLFAQVGETDRAREALSHALRVEPGRRDLDQRLRRLRDATP